MSLMDSLTPDVSCLIGLTAADMAAVAPIPMVHPARWYAAPDESAMAALNGTVVDGRVMAAVEVCGADLGRFMSLVAEDGVPFSDPFRSMFSDDGFYKAPVLDGNRKDYINDRLENALPVVAEDGSVTTVAAGKVRFGHSPETILYLEDLLEWHDRNEGTLVRFRLHDVVTDDGHTLLVAAGGVVPGVTWKQLEQIRHAEVSPEFVEVDESGTLEYIALSMVFYGNTNTSLPARAAKIRSVASKEATMSASTTTAAVQSVRRAEVSPGVTVEVHEAAVAALEDQVTTMGVRVAELESSIADLVSAMMGQIAPGRAHRSMLRTIGDLYEAVAERVRGTYEAPGLTYVWLQDVSIDASQAFFSVMDYEDGSERMFRESFTFDSATEVVSLTGDRAEVDRDVTYVEVIDTGAAI